MTRKNVFLALTLLLVSLFLLSSCSQNDPETQIPLEDLEFVLETPSEELQARFVEEYVAYQKYDPEDHPTVAIERWYGSFGDIHFLFVSDCLDYHQAHWTDVVADSSFDYVDGQSIRVWVDGQFLTIKNAYEQNFITKEMVATIANIHNGSAGNPIEMQ